MGLRKEDIASQVESIDWKDSVRCVVDGDGLTAHSRSGNVITGDSVGNIGVQDGITLANGDEVALDYAAPNVNTGLYVVDEIGGAGVFQLTRRNDFDTDGKVTAGVRVPIEEGTTFGNVAIKLATTGTIQINVTALDFKLSIDFGTTAGTATEGNDSRVPTQDENDALVGTDGSPSTANKFVTDSDPRFTNGALPIVLPGAPATAAADTMVVAEDHTETITFPDTPPDNTRVGVITAATFNDGILQIFPGASDAFLNEVPKELMQYGNAIWQYFAGANLWLQIQGVPLSLGSFVHAVPIAFANINANDTPAIGVTWNVQDSVAGNVESETRVRIDVTAVNHTDADPASAAHWILEAVYTRDGATVKEESKVVLLEEKPGIMAGADFDIVINGTDLELTCTGLAGKNFSWSGEGHVRDSVR